MTRLAAAHIAKRNGKPFQLLPVSSMIACTTFGPIMLDARFESPKSPKNCRARRQRRARAGERGGGRTMLSKPGGVSSAIIVCEKA